MGKATRLELETAKAEVIRLEKEIGCLEEQLLDKSDDVAAWVEKDLVYRQLNLAYQKYDNLLDSFLSD